MGAKPGGLCATVQCVPSWHLALITGSSGLCQPVPWELANIRSCAKKVCIPTGQVETDSAFALRPHLVGLDLHHSGEHPPRDENRHVLFLGHLFQELVRTTTLAVHRHDCIAALDLILRRLRLVPVVHKAFLHFPHLENFATHNADVQTYPLVLRRLLLDHHLELLVGARASNWLSEFGLIGHGDLGLVIQEINRRLDRLDWLTLAISAAAAQQRHGLQLKVTSHTRQLRSLERNGT
mmetsp:Transcript_25567/g.57935  ORF Transcript_25567/g.57935 Transcript_25567/m.57935 type:complete len:237 (+) Transcript_25567:1-711(+)